MTVTPCVTGTGVMAESNGLERPGVDKAAGEEFLKEALQILLDEAVRKGTDVTEKVGDSRCEVAGTGRGCPCLAGARSCVCPRPPTLLLLPTGL